LRADGRLRAIAGLGGLGKTFQPDDFEECMELIEVHKPLAGLLKPAVQSNNESAG
jgi:hypothetical protein